MTFNADGNWTISLKYRSDLRLLAIDARTRQKLLLINYQPVAHARFGSNNRRVNRVLLNFLSQLANKHPQVMQVIAMGWSPDGGEQGFMGNNPPCMAHKQGQQVIFLGR